MVGAKTLVASHAVGAAATEEDRKPLHPYVYKRETACGIIIDVDDRCDERGERVRAFVADCEAAANRLPKNAVAAIRDAGCRIVVHEETGKWTHMCYHPRQGQSWLRDQGRRELGWVRQLCRLDDSPATGASGARAVLLCTSSRTPTRLLPKRRPAGTSSSDGATTARSTPSGSTTL